jgi:HSP20 family protein
MAITRWTPMRELMNVHDQLNRFFDDAFGIMPRGGDFDAGTWAPAVDLREEEGGFVLQADMPGIKKEDIDVHVENNILTIQGERKFESETKKDTYHRIERAYGKFTRSFALPVRVHAEGIKATYKDGILEVSIPKAEESKPKKIAVQG